MTSQSAENEAVAVALAARCSRCDLPFSEHESRLTPTARGGLRASMTCPIPPE